MDELMTRMSEQEIKYAAGAEKSAVASAFEQNRRGQNYGQSVGSADETTRREGEIAGRIISVSNLKVEIFLKRTDVGIRDLLCAEKDGVRYMFEVQEINGQVAAAICCGQTRGLRRGMEVWLQEGGLRIAYDAQILGHVFNPYGDTIDGTTLEAPRMAISFGRASRCWTSSRRCARASRWVCSAAPA